jgi:hypothetical protein
MPESAHLFSHAHFVDPSNSKDDFLLSLFPFLAPYFPHHSRMSLPLKLFFFPVWNFKFVYLLLGHFRSLRFCFAFFGRASYLHLFYARFRICMWIWMVECFWIMWVWRGLLVDPQLKKKMELTPKRTIYN